MLPEIKSELSIRKEFVLIPVQGNTSFATIFDENRIWVEQSRTVKTVLYHSNKSKSVRPSKSCMCLRKYWYLVIHLFLDWNVFKIAS
jgi:hypothetical protein